MRGFLIPADSICRLIEFDDYLLMGQDESCQWQVSDSCPRHAKIEWQNGNFILKDLRSQSGTFLNDQRISEAPIEEGDWIRIGTQERQFSFSSTPEKASFPMKSRSPEWNSKLERLGSAARTEFPVLILGPSGTGKEVIAQNIHQTSQRSTGPFVSVNCSALSENLIESELFGHLKGSFTGAICDRKGAFEAARHGTLFLDEIGDLPLNLQAKLLRALENSEIRPVGSDHNVRTDVRILAATHQNLVQRIQSGHFRADLYYRLNVIHIDTPKLHERMEDFEELLYHFAKLMKVRFSFLAIQRLKKHSWPGNIRELRNTVARACAHFPKQTITPEHVEEILDKSTFDPKVSGGEPQPHLGLPLIKEMERQMIIKKLEANKGNQRQTALDLGLPKSTLHDRLRAYNIDPKFYV